MAITDAINDGDEAVLDSMTREQLEQAAKEYDENRQRFDVAPAAKHLLGRFTLVCLVLNRTIGSGIFTVPPKVLAGTGSVGGSLMIWVAGGLIVICGALCWLELGLSIPFHTITENGELRRVSAPRSGGEKNFLEYMFKKPLFFITSVYGIMFLVLGNISGNAVAFGIYVMIAAGKDPIYDSSSNYHKGAVIGLAVATLTVCAGLHIFTRRGGILVNNTFAVVKVAMALALAILGFIHAGGKYLKSEGINEVAILNQPAGIPNITSSAINEAPSHNLNIHTSFYTDRSDIASYVDSFLFVLFTYTGFEQPFYVLSEVARPRKVFPTYTILGMAIATLLYTLVNVSYFCVVPKEVYTQTPSNSINMAGAFLHYLFDSSDGPDTAKRVMAGLIAISVFGNVLVMTFTAARVKQEIAKEGILPWSLFFASGRTTPWAWLRSRMGHGTERPRSSEIEGFSLEDHVEKSPMAALALHWFTSVLLVLVTAPLKPVTAYSFLTALYSYVNLNVVGFLVSGGLVYLKLDSFFRGERGRNWANKASYIPWISPLHAIIYLAATGFFLFATFTKPASDSTFTKAIQGYAWYLLPTIGLSSLLWGVFWWLGLKTIERNRRRRLVVTRTPYIERDEDGSYVQKAELVEHEWLTVVKSDTESDVSEKMHQRFAKS